MSAVVFRALIFDRAAISFRSRSIAMIAIVLIDPASVLSPGFQMSFAATGGLIAAYDYWSRRRTFSRGLVGKVRFSMASLVVTSVIASATTAPYALYHFDRLATVGLLANLLAMPVITFVRAPAATLSIVL